ncbi:MAG: hypothetical protein HZB39_08995 [Planctomycetes bacterium]|nr:hypothetical protein [Planctomycetota bacterium]
MSRARGVAVVACCVLVGVIVVLRLRAQIGGTSDESTVISPLAVVPRSELLARTRLVGSIDALDRFVAEQRERCANLTAGAEEWRVLAESLLERCLSRDTLKGMAVGRLTHKELPAEHRADLDAGLEAIDAALARGDDTADAQRIRSALLSLSATSWTDVLRLRARVEAALRAAEAIDADHPRVIVARACEKLFAPNRFLGHDPAAARRMLEKAATALELDERPFLLAAMCAWLLEQRDDAITLLERAAARNPNNRYLTAVLSRLRADEDDPFGRDVKD